MLGSTAATPVEIWFQDEARVGQKGGHTYVWAELGSRPPMIRDNRHDSAYIFGAICPARAVGAAIIAPAANAECMNLHLQEISTQVTPGSIAALVCDSAGWHQTGGELELPNNIVLLPLEPYSPELNPMENVWEYLRGNKLSARVWDSYEAIVEDAQRPGTSSSTIPTTSALSASGIGQQSIFRATGIRPKIDE